MTPEVTELWQQLAAALARAEAAERQLVWERERIRIRMDTEPCQCDPPGSGEEFCRGDCWIACYREQNAALLEEGA